jgi:DNA-binding MarR family transcriptional regulator
LELSRRLRTLGERLHGQGEPSAARRDVLSGLERHGAQTVPQMARARSVTRQHVQALVNLLAETGYVECIENPAHKRSGLVRLTRRGREFVATMDQREAWFLRQLNVGATNRELGEAVAVLRAVREALDDESSGRLLEGEAGPV